MAGREMASAVARARPVADMLDGAKGPARRPRYPPSGVVRTRSPKPAPLERGQCGEAAGSEEGPNRDGSRPLSVARLPLMSSDAQRRDPAVHSVVHITRSYAGERQRRRMRVRAPRRCQCAARASVRRDDADLGLHPAAAAGRVSKMEGGAGVGRGRSGRASTTTSCTPRVFSWTGRKRSRKRRWGGWAAARCWRISPTSVPRRMSRCVCAPVRVACVVHFHASVRARLRGPFCVLPVSATRMRGCVRSQARDRSGCELQRVECINVALLMSGQ